MTSLKCAFITGSALGVSLAVYTEWMQFIAAASGAVVGVYGVGQLVYKWLKK